MSRISVGAIPFFRGGEAGWGRFCYNVETMKPIAVHIADFETLRTFRHLTVQHAKGTRA